MPRRLTDNSNDDKRRKAPSSSSQRTRRGAAPAGEESGRRRSHSEIVPEEGSIGTDKIKDALKKAKGAPKRAASKSSKTAEKKETVHDAHKVTAAREPKAKAEKTHEIIPQRTHRK